LDKQLIMRLLMASWLINLRLLKQGRLGLLR
jgi:hypothetical protein